MVGIDYTKAGIDEQKTEVSLLKVLLQRCDVAEQRNMMLESRIARLEALFIPQTRPEQVRTTPEFQSLAKRIDTAIQANGGAVDVPHTEAPLTSEAFKEMVDTFLSERGTRQMNEVKERKLDLYDQAKIDELVAEHKDSNG